MGSNVILEIKDLYANVIIDENKEIEILKGLSLTISGGETHVLMGVNGSGKSTLANTLMGHPYYRITGGDAIFIGKSILDMKPEERARLGMFLAFQYPTAVPGLSVVSYLRSMLKAVSGEDISYKEFKKKVSAAMDALKIPDDFLKRSLNEGFSGGEKKRMEVLQMSLINPVLAMLDETDSGLDVDAMKLVFGAIRKLKSENNSQLLITHYNKVLNYIEPDHVHILKSGKIMKSGGMELSNMIEEKGFEAVLNG